MSPAVGAAAPLLTRRETPAERRLLICRAVFNVSTTIIGAGIMSIPATLKVVGVIPAFILMAVMAVLVDISVDFLLRFTYAGNATTYAGLMKESFGKMGSLLLQICIIITSLGCLIMYLIIIGDVLCGNGSPDHLGVLQEWFGNHWWNSRAFAIFFVVLFVMLPLVSYRRVESLWWSSALAVVLALVFVGVCVVMAICALVNGETQTPRLLPRLPDGPSFLNLFTAVPVIVTAFTFHFNVHPIGIELGKPSTMATAVKISLLLCALVYFSIGIFGYLLFGEAINADILVNFAAAGTSSGSATGAVLNDVVRLSYALHLVMVFPLLNYPLRSNIDELFFPEKKLHLSNDTVRFACLSLVLLALAYGAAVLVPSIWYIFQFLGSTSAVLLAFIFPGAIALRDIHGISSRKDKIVATIMIIQAIVTSCIAISSNVYNIITGANS
ncbi:unnamed protein product [Cuscuta campestris]|uniref:Amino acid transporter transmembrane domain-containing protein n=1 Tax=Cuscuta campestris TaxID=132261 RepID=A0A484MQ26_9ASTE|nr:unnamed protein product [Cuscuta campestris]